MERELTIKVNYVLGNGSAFEAAAVAAENVNRKVASGFDKLASAVGPQAGSGLSGIASLLRGGVAGAMGYFGVNAAIGAGNMIGSSIFAQGARGAGVVGAFDSVFGGISGRGVREHWADVKTGLGGAQAGIFGEGLATDTARFSIFNASRFAPSTAVDPFQRQREERELLIKQQAAAREAYKSVQSKYNQEMKAMDEINKSKQGANDDAVNTLNRKKLQEAYYRHTEQFKAGELQRGEQLAQFDKAFYEQRKSSIRDFKLDFGGKTLAEQQSFKIAAGLLDAGQELLPEQIAMLRTSPVHAEKLNKHLMKNAERAGADDVLKTADTEIKRAAESKAAFKAVGGNMEVEDFLASGEQFKESFKTLQALAKSMTATMKDVAEYSNQIKIDILNLQQIRGAIGPGR